MSAALQTLARATQGAPVSAFASQLHRLIDAQHASWLGSLNEIISRYSLL
jgi:hypothetical protein